MLVVSRTVMCGLGLALVLFAHAHSREARVASKRSLGLIDQKIITL